MKLDKALAWTRRGKAEPPQPWWKRQVRRVTELRPRQSESKLSGPRAAASSPWAKGAAAVGVATAGVVAVARRRRETSRDTDGSEMPGDATDPPQSPDETAGPSESSRAPEEGVGPARPPDA